MIDCNHLYFDSLIEPEYLYFDTLVKLNLVNKSSLEPFSPPIVYTTTTGNTNLEPQYIQTSISSIPFAATTYTPFKLPQKYPAMCETLGRLKLVRKETRFDKTIIFKTPVTSLDKITLEIPDENLQWKDPYFTNQ